MKNDSNCHEVYYHIVFIPKDREQRLTGTTGRRLRTIFAEIFEGTDLGLIDVDIMSDHVHLFIGSPSRNEPSFIVNWLESISIQKYNERFDDRIRWMRSYYVGTAGGVSKDAIHQYN